LQKEAIKPSDPKDGMQKRINNQQVSPLKRKRISQDDTPEYGNIEVQLKKPSVQKDSFCEGGGNDLDFDKDNQVVGEEQNNYKKLHCEGSHGEGEDEDEEEDGNEDTFINHISALSRLKPMRKRRFPWTDRLERYT